MNQKSLTAKTFTGFFWTVGGKVFTAILQILVVAVLARLISPSSFGIAQAALIVVGFAKIISEIGIGPALIQIKDLNNKHIGTGFSFSLGLGILIGINIFLGSGLLSNFFNMPELSNVIKVISVIFLFESVITVSDSLIQREMKLKAKSLIEIISYFIGYGIFGIIFAYLGYDYWALVIAILVQAFIKFVSYLFLQSHSLKPMWNKAEFKELIQFAGGYTAGRIFSKLASEADNLITGKFIGAHALGMYSRAYTIMSKPINMIGDAVNISLFPAIAKRQDKTTRLTDVFINVSRLLLFPSIIVSMVIFVSAKEVIFVLLGEGWGESVIPLKVLALGTFFRLGYKLGSELSKATGYVNKRAWYLFIFCVLSIVGSYIGVQFGIKGVAVGMLFAIIINYILMTHLGLSILHKSWFYFIKNISLEVIIAMGLGILYVIIYFIISSINTNPWVILFISYSIYGVLLLLSFYLFGKKMRSFSILPFKDKLNKILR